MAAVAQPLGGFIEHALHTTTEIEAFVYQSDFHEAEPCGSMFREEDRGHVQRACDSCLNRLRV